MNLLVTGGLGFIGSNFIQYWSEKHRRDTIVNLDKVTYAANFRNLDGLRAGFDYSFVKGDICDQRVVDRLVRNSDAVVNFAAETHVDNSIANQEPFIRSNIVGVYKILTSVKKHGTRFHQVSTDEVYGSLELNSKKKFTENSRYDPRNPYSATKAAADHLINAYYNTYKVPVSISNCSNNYGPRMHPEKFIPKAITNALKDEKIPVYGDGKQVRDWIYAADHCSAIDLILKKGELGETYLVSAGQERRNIDVVLMILRELGKGRDLVKFVKDRPGHDLRYALDAGKLRRELGWRSSVSFEKGLRLTIDYYMELGSTRARRR